MTTGIWILGDQLHLGQAALASVMDRPESTPVVMVESHHWVRQRAYHKQKLVLIWSAMRHFAQDLEASGYPVTYLEAETFVEPLRQWAETHQLDQIRVVTPTDIPFRRQLEAIRSSLPCELKEIESNHFLWSTSDFVNWSQGRKRLLMEDFYREGRKRYQILMDGDQPVGGRWNFDQDNRKPPKSEQIYPQPLSFELDAITQAVIEKVESDFKNHFGQVQPFGWAVNRVQALHVLQTFVDQQLDQFGPYQDAMVMNEETLWHALISPYLNIGLLTPREVIQAAQTAYESKGLAIASVEGFIRQILGWREYMRGLYETVLPNGYDQLNWFQHDRPLPEFFWTGDTDMTCLQQTIQQLQRTGYAHHIQRLMILSNFALISGINPQALESWFHDVFIDSFDWVMQPNVIGMGLFADGGSVATKPYAASANYINKMSDYCQNCRYNHNDKTSERACPFNYFYWDFLLRHRHKLSDLGRMGLVLSHLKRMDGEVTAQIQALAHEWWQANS